MSIAPHTLKIKAPDWLLQPDMTLLLNILADNGVQVYFVGGCVRDTLLGNSVVDLDACSSALPEQLLAITSLDYPIKIIPTGLAHGTVSVLYKDIFLEITTLRKDISCDGRHAEVTYTDSLAEDAKRRDFTINALYLDPQIEHKHVTIYDYVGGLNDIQPPVIRFIGDVKKRLAEDYLRILRYFRFNAMYYRQDFASCTDDLQACGGSALHIAQLSGERIGHEMVKLLNVPSIHYGDIIKVMQLHGVARYIFGTDDFELVVTPYQYWLVRLALFIRQMQGDRNIILSSITGRWKFSNKDKRMLSVLCLGGMNAEILTCEHAMKQFIRKHGNEVALHLLHIYLAEQNLVVDDVEAFHTLCQRWSIPKFPVTGVDLLEMGFKSGVEMGNSLRRLEQLWELSEYKMSKQKLLQHIKVSG